MKNKKLLSLMLALAMMFSLTVTASAEETMVISPAPADEIVILHTNDVHCNYEAYDKVAALAKDADLLVDAGDAIQGGVIGTLSKGEYIVDIMNEIGYDVAVPGNHEFDYDMDQFLKLAREKAEYPYISANFVDKTGKSVFDAYKLFEVDGKKVAFVGLSPPETFTKSTPTYFQDANGNYIYGFCEGGNGQELYAAAQKAIDAAEAAGADYVIGLGHLGIDGESSPWTSKEVIANTTGFDAFIDGHSHSTFAETVKDKAGNDVAFAQTGTKLKTVGELVIGTDGKISSRLRKTDIGDDAKVQKVISREMARYEAVLNQPVGEAVIQLKSNDPKTGERLVRNSECSLADFVTDALKAVLNCDVVMVNGGSIRNEIKQGTITYNDMLEAFPFGNMCAVIEATGQQILDALEMGASHYPEEFGGFYQVAGMEYTINASVPSTVQLDDKGNFSRVGGLYRVSDVRIGGQPLDVNKKYTVGGTTYVLKDGGDGNVMFKGAKLLKDGEISDVDAIIEYLQKHLNGKIGDKYANPYGDGRITIK